MKIINHVRCGSEFQRFLVACLCGSPNLNCNCGELYLGPAPRKLSQQGVLFVAELVGVI